VKSDFYSQTSVALSFTTIDSVLKKNQNIRNNAQYIVIPIRMLQLTMENEFGFQLSDAPEFL